MTWNLHIVGDKVLEEVDTIANAIVKAVEDAGHTLISAVLTTDLGPKDITPPPAPVSEPAAVDPTAQPVAEPETDTTPVQNPVEESQAADTQSPAEPEAVPTDTPPVA